MNRKVISNAAGLFFCSWLMSGLASASGMCEYLRDPKLRTWTLYQKDASTRTEWSVTIDPPSWSSYAYGDITGTMTGRVYPSMQGTTTWFQGDCHDDRLTLITWVSQDQVLWFWGDLRSDNNPIGWFSWEGSVLKDNQVHPAGGAASCNLYGHIPGYSYPCR